MTHTPDYPLFIPPPHLSEKAPREWTAREASEYLSWLVSAIEPRTNHLLERFDERIEGNPESLLERLGWKASGILRRPGFNYSSGGSRRLTDAGYALAADLGLLIARLLCEHTDGVEWAVKRKPRRDASYNLPVLRGFGSMDLDPVGGSIAEATAVLQGRRDADAWKRVYCFWKGRTGAM